MDPTLYNAAMRGNIGDANFLLADHLKMDEESGYQVTPKGNTVLHVAALYGNSHFAREVLKITPALLCCQNKKNETALHIASNEGHTEVVRALLECVEDHNTKEKLTRMMDASGDTALHKAVRSQHLDVVKLLVKEDPEFEFPPNHAQETPLYLAAESGFHDALINILEFCKKPTYAAGPSNRTPLHAAIIHEHKDCFRSLWRWNKPLCEELDLWGWNSLHYAVKLGLKDVVSDMLRWKKSLVYLPAGGENDWTTAIHIAASEGDVNMINELLNHCPDCWDTLNRDNQNALHVSVLNYEDEVVRFLLDSDKCDSLVDEPDSDGNTPLHLLAASGIHIPELIYHPRAKKMSFNKQNQTPLDIALSCEATTEKEILVEDLCSIGQFGKREFEVNRKYEYIPNPNDETRTGVKMQLREDDHDKANKIDQTEVESIMKSTQLHIVVATLIMTVTFAAGITLPGGFESDPDSPNKGMAILIRKTTFRAFVISDAIAFTFSAFAIFIYFIMANASTLPRHEKLIQKLYGRASNFLCLSMLAVVIAFATGMFATLSHSLGLAVTVCSIDCLPILLYFLVAIYIGRYLNIYYSKMKNISQ
ncbi:ankyrin repeat-containing protein ITN1-like [Capsicum annuum]|uniref:ankyrin repeat-containing protein ITN1-like n=1 Tax=Capsicum annuum TaxID=4072 RepID=UPI001FB07220|nr:ankyrin repeat-containing protein ITN1-like [Capsicum annuum]